MMRSIDRPINSTMTRNVSKTSIASVLFTLSAIFYNPTVASSNTIAPYNTSRNQFVPTRKNRRKRTSKQNSAQVRQKSSSLHNNNDNEEKIKRSYDDNRVGYSTNQRRKDVYNDYFENESANTKLNLQQKRKQLKFENEYSRYEKEDNDNGRDRNIDPAETNSSLELLQVPLSLVLQHESSSENTTPIKTYIDTGAQVTIMTLAAAKRAGIAHLLDTRYAGHASGVAGVSCRVLGRIPARSVSFVLNADGCTHVLDNTPAITVLEKEILGGGNHGAVDMLMGLDILEEWKATLCLYDRTLTVRDGKVGGNSNSLNGSSNRNMIIPLSSSRRAFAPSVKSHTRHQEFSSIKSAPRNRKPNSSSIDYMRYNNYSEASSIESSNLSSNRGGKYLTQDEEEEYNDDNYYFIDNDEEDFDECDLSGV